MSHPLWQEEYWLYIIQLFLKKPEGVKHLYSRPLVDLSLELHIEPAYLHSQLRRLRHIDSPKLRRLWDKYSTRPKQLDKKVDILRRMRGFGNAEAFYKDVEVDVDWERMYKPLPSEPRLKPFMLVIILDLYFRLTPNTMVDETPEIIELAKLTHIPTQLIVDVLQCFLACDPYLNFVPNMDNNLLAPCGAIWNEYGSLQPQQLEGIAAQMKFYFN